METPFVAIVQTHLAPFFDEVAAQLALLAPVAKKPPVNWAGRE